MMFKVLGRNTIAGLALGAVFLGTTLAASSAEQVKVGALRCNVSAALGLIITSHRELSCMFTSLHGWHEHYFGSIQKFGLDLGATNRGILVWDVFAPTDGQRRRALAGDYGGVEASATLGVGAGANVLLGGSHRSFALQPISIEGQIGLSLAAGVESFKLR